MIKPSVNTQLIETIFKLSRLMKDNMTYCSELTTLTLLQMQALIFLKKHKSAQMREIAAYFKIEMPTATSLVNKLNKMNLANRQADLEDRRLVRIILTEQGNQLLEKAMKERTEKMKHILSNLSESDTRELLRILQLITKHMEKKNEK